MNLLTRVEFHNLEGLLTVRSLKNYDLKLTQYFQGRWMEILVYVPRTLPVMVIQDVVCRLNILAHVLVMTLVTAKKVER